MLISNGPWDTVINQCQNKGRGPRNFLLQAFSCITAQDISIPLAQFRFFQNSQSKKKMTKPLSQIWDVHRIPDPNVFIPDPGSKRSQIQTKEFKYFFPKTVSKLPEK
jgi:hypothetical protein